MKQEVKVGDEVRIAVSGWAGRAEVRARVLKVHGLSLKVEWLETAAGRKAGQDGFPLLSSVVPA